MMSRPSFGMLKSWRARQRPERRSGFPKESRPSYGPPSGASSVVPLGSHIQEAVGSGHSSGLFAQSGFEAVSEITWSVINAGCGQEEMSKEGENQVKCRSSLVGREVSERS